MTATSHTRVVTLLNMRGLHARAATKLVATCNCFEAEVLLRFKGKEVKAHSLMAVMMLGAGVGNEIELVAKGRQATEVLDALTELINNRFEEEN